MKNLVNNIFINYGVNKNIKNSNLPDISNKKIKYKIVKNTLDRNKQIIKNEIIKSNKSQSNDKKIQKTEEKPKVLAIARGIILYKNNILLLKRINNNKVNSGLWEFPGGKIQKNEDIWEALKQEVKEETSLEVNVLSDLAFIRSKVLNDNSKYKEHTLIETSVLATAKNNNVKISFEHQDYKWINLKKVDKLIDNDLKVTQATKDVIKNKMFNKLLKIYQ